MRSLKLFRVWDINIQLHYSWFFIFFLLVWSLATAVFPQQVLNESNNTYWLLGIAAALLLFISVLLHELSHSLVAKLRGIKVESITLFFFGGVASITKDEMKASTELMMALAGPLFSFVLGGVFYWWHAMTGNVLLQVLTTYIYQLNFILGAFNLLPGFPLDGGRAFRAILYAYYKDLRKATRIATFCGRAIGVVLMLLGMWFVLQGGLWFILIGGFIYFLAGASYEQVLYREVLGRIKVKEVVHQLIEVNAEKSFLEFVHGNLNKDQENFLVKGKNFLGLLEMKRLGKTSSAAQKQLLLRQLAVPLREVKGVELQESAYTAFKMLMEQQRDVIPVKRKGKVAGFVTRNCLMHHLIWNLKYGSK